MSGDGFDNVAPIRPQLGKNAQRFRDGICLGSKIEAPLERNYLIKGWIDRDSVSVVYGPPNVGKTFLALDIAQHVASGIRWGGCRVRRADVLYVAGEGGGGFRRRLSAIGDPAFYTLEELVNLTRTGQDAGPLAEAVMAMQADFGLIIIDTLARAMGGKDENASADMGDFLAGVEKLRKMTGAHIMLIHHSGKDVERGARGHSSLRGAIDTEIMVKREDDNTGTITAKALKQRDYATGEEFQYRLRPVTLGVDSDGDTVSSCIVSPVNAPR